MLYTVYTLNMQKVYLSIIHQQTEREKRVREATVDSIQELQPNITQINIPIIRNPKQNREWEWNWAEEIFEVTMVGDPPK